MDSKNVAESIIENVTEALTSSKKFFLCRHCKHERVCKKIEDEEMQCEDFLNSGDYKTYGNIYSFFQPIFDWLKFHYPAGEVKFVVDRTSAKMYLEHGPAAFSKEITDFCACQPKVEQKQTVDETEEKKSE